MIPWKWRSVGSYLLHSTRAPSFASLKRTKSTLECAIGFCVADATGLLRLCKVARRSRRRWWKVGFLWAQQKIEREREKEREGKFPSWWLVGSTSSFTIYPIKRISHSLNSIWLLTSAACVATSEQAKRPSTRRNGPCWTQYVHDP